MLFLPLFLLTACTVGQKEVEKNTIDREKQTIDTTESTSIPYFKENTLVTNDYSLKILDHQYAKGLDGGSIVAISFEITNHSKVEKTALSIFNAAFTVIQKNESGTAVLEPTIAVETEKFETALDNAYVFVKPNETIKTVELYKVKNPYNSVIIEIESPDLPNSYIIDAEK